MAVQAEDQKAKAEREKAEEKGKQGERLLWEHIRVQLRKISNSFLLQKSGKDYTQPH